MKRREFLKTSALAAAAAALPLKAKASEETTKPTGIREYREIGKTGMKMSDISFGTGKLPGKGLVLRAIDAGINYFDTAPDYGAAEDHIARYHDLFFSPVQAD